MATVPVKILNSNGRSALIEWLDNDGVMRGIIPQEVIVDDFVNEEHLSLAIPYGIDWAYALENAIPKVTPQEFAAVLHQYNIWTLEDLTSNPARSFTAIQAVYGLDFQTLVKFAKSYKDNGG